MREVGIRELKEQSSAILRRVREEKETITITYRGRPVARLVPVEDADVLWSELDQLALEIGSYWPKEISAAEAVKEQRRELPLKDTAELSISALQVLDKRIQKLQTLLEQIHALVLSGSQAYYWTPEWQAKEQRADEDARLGRSKQYSSVEELIRELNG